MQLILDALTGRSSVWPEDAAASFEAEVLDAAATEGVAPLLARARRVADAQGWPPRVAAALDRTLADEAALEVCRRAELRRLLAAFRGAGVTALVFKGAALAYQVFEQPWLRPRRDTDLLIAAGEGARAAGVLRDLGYDPLVTTSGRLVSGQNQWMRRDAVGTRHAVDLHWRIVNPHAFARLLPFAALASRAVQLPPLGGAARAPSLPDALVIACLHRVVHHYGSENLLWLYDIHLLSSSLPADGQQTFLDLVARTGTGAICAEGLTLAHEAFAGEAAAALERRIGSRALPRAWRRFMIRGVSQMDVLWSDLRVLGSWRDRATLVREHLFPPAEYMRARYGTANGAGLPALYARRVARGVRRWFAAR